MIQLPLYDVITSLANREEVVMGGGEDKVACLELSADRANSKALSNWSTSTDPVGSFESLFDPST